MPASGTDGVCTYVCREILLCILSQPTTPIIDLPISEGKCLSKSPFGIALFLDWLQQYVCYFHDKGCGTSS